MQLLVLYYPLIRIGLKLYDHRVDERAQIGDVMRKLIEMPYDETTSVWVAVDIPEELFMERSEDGIKQTSVSDSIRDLLVGKPERAENNFHNVTDMIVRYSRPIIESFQILRNDKDFPVRKASAEFSVSFAGKGNVYLVETSVGGAIKVNLEWELEGKGKTA